MVSEVPHTLNYKGFLKAHGGWVTSLAVGEEVVGKDKKGVKAERALFVQAMIERGHVKPDGKPTATVDTYWMRVKIASGSRSSSA